MLSERKAFPKCPLASAGTRGPVRQEFWANEDVQGETGCQAGNKREECHPSEELGPGP